MTTITPERHDPALRPAEPASPRPPRLRRAWAWAMAAAFVCALTLVSGGGLPAFATTAPPTVGAGGAGSTTGSVSSARTAGVGGCPNCDDHDACTDDTCDANYECVHTPITCDDQLRCTDDICDPAIGCVYTPKDCSTGSVCVTEACSEATGECVLVSKRLCNDHNACTVDSCDPETGCLHAPLLCSDGDLCTFDSCDPLVGCVHRSGACGHGPGASAPGTGTDLPGITADAGDDSAEVAAPQPSDRDARRSREAREAARRAIGEADFCALAANLPADTLTQLLREGWPSSPDAAAGAGVEWSLRISAEVALDAGLCPSRAIGRASWSSGMRP